MSDRAHFALHLLLAVGVLFNSLAILLLGIAIIGMKS